MASNLRLFSSESVTEGRLDKTCDSILDFTLDAMLTQDSALVVVIETVVTISLIHVIDKVRTKSYAGIPSIVRSRLEEIGFDSSEKGFDGKICGIFTSTSEQSLDTHNGVCTSLEARSSDGEVEAGGLKGAGDQGLMSSYAANETPEYVPLPTALAHHLVRRLTQIRKEDTVLSLRPDGKTQVTFVHDRDNNPVYLDTVVVFTQHDPGVTQEWITEWIKTYVVGQVLDDANLRKHFVTDELKLLVNSSGRFIIGDPMSDADLTSYKIVVNIYGGVARHGGDVFSGKGPSEVDRSAVYATRWVAKNVVAAGLAGHLKIQVVRAIGRVRPVGLYVDSFGTGYVSDDATRGAINKVFDLHSAATTCGLDLLRLIYAQASAYSHLGRTGLGLPREQLNRVEELHTAASLG